MHNGTLALPSSPTPRSGPQPPFIPFNSRSNGTPQPRLSRKQRRADPGYKFRQQQKRVTARANMLAQKQAEGQKRADSDTPAPGNISTWSMPRFAAEIWNTTTAAAPEPQNTPRDHGDVLKSAMIGALVVGAAILGTFAVVASPCLWRHKSGESIGGCGESTKPCASVSDESEDADEVSDDRQEIMVPFAELESEEHWDDLEHFYGSAAPDKAQTTPLSIVDDPELY